MAKTAATPKISVIERRLQGPSVFRANQEPIPLVNPKAWTVRWVMVDEHRHDRLWEMQHKKGWVYADQSDLACPVEDMGARVENGRIVRGTRGSEVLMKMATKDYAKVVKAKDAEVTKQTFGTKQMKQAIVEGVGATHGERAAEFVAQNVNAITVQDTRAPEDAA